MTSPTYETDPSQEGPETSRPGPECDPGLLDELKCRAKGIDAEAKYNSEHMAALSTARTQYDAARAGYSAARAAATPTIADLNHQLAQVIDQLKCLIDNRHDIRRLYRAYDKVKERLDECGDKSGCYFTDDCDFDDEVRHCRPEDVPGKIADIGRRTKAAEDAFADLIQEPTNLPARVTKLQAEIAEIVTKMGGDPKTADFRRLFAAALVARRHLHEVWRGFQDANVYIDCLCRALTCQLKGHTAIAILKGKEAVYECHQQSKEEACQHLRDNTVDEVMAEYLRISAMPHNGDDEDSYGGGEGSGGGGGGSSGGGSYGEEGRGGGEAYDDRNRNRYRDDRERGPDRDRYRYREPGQERYRGGEEGAAP